MCGIAGWVDFERDLRQERATALAMTATMACRGPDDEGLHLAQHAALGHRRLAVIDFEKGDQPKALHQETGRPADARRGEGDLAIVYSGEVYNFREQRAELVAAGVELLSHSDTEVVLQQHRRHGLAAVEEFNGMFAYALWDDRAQQLHLVRDRLGIKPLYYFPTATGVLFGSEPKAILAHPEVRPVVDAEGLRRLFAFAAERGATPYRGMHEVMPGHVVTIDRDGVHDRTYWEITSHEHTDDQETTVARVRELLLDTVKRQLVSDVPLCTLLSGGLDSSALTAMAARGLAEQGRGAVRSFAVDFAGHADRFTPDELRGTPDAPYVADVAQHVHSQHSDIVLDNAALLDPEHRERVLRARDLPGYGEIDTSLLLLFEAVRRESTVALSGESADEVFGGYRQFHDPEAVAADTFPWLVGAGARMVAPTRLLAPAYEKALDLEQHTAEQYAAAIAEVPRLDGETGHEARMREICYLHLTRFLPRLLDRKDRMSMAVGLEVRVPFCDHRLVDYVFNTPWALKTFDGREKSLLRAATADLLPESVVQRVKSPYPSTQDPGYVAATAAELARRLRSDDGALPDLADHDAVADLVADPQVSDQNAVDRLLLLDDWVREYGVTLDV